MLWARTGSKVGQIAECVFRVVSWGLMLFTGGFTGTTLETFETGLMPRDRMFLFR